MKEFLSRQGIKYQEKNVQLDRQAAQEMVSRSGQMGVPVTIIADEVIVGFNQPALQAAVTKLRGKQANGTASDGLKLGAQVANASEVLAKQGKIVRSGAILGAVKPDSLAARAGLHEGDVIVAINDCIIANAEDLATQLRHIAAKQIARPSIIFWRDEREMDTRLPV